MTDTKSSPEGENLSRIKDILFGEDLQGIDQKFDVFKKENSSAFEKLKRDLETRFRKIDQLLGEKDKEAHIVQEKNVEVQETTNANLKKEISNIKLEIKNEKINIENAISNNLQELTEKISNLEKTISELINNLKEEHELKINDLNNNKIDKILLADLFTGLAENLKK